MIEVVDLTVRYGAAVALDGVSLTVGAGEMVALIGSTDSMVSSSCDLRSLRAWLLPGFLGAEADWSLTSHFDEHRL